MRGGLLGSLVLHLAVMLLVVLGLPWLRPMPPVEQIVPVNLVRLGDKTAAPASAAVAPLPQEKAKEVANSEPTEAVPLPETPPPQGALRHAAERSPSDPVTSKKPGQQQKTPQAVEAPKLDTAATRLQRPPSPAEELAERLKTLSHLRQPPAAMPPSPRQQDGSGSSNVTATSDHAAPAWDATYGVKDFIRAQVERRWNFDRNAATAGNWTVSIHIVLAPDGRVTRAEIVDDPRYRSNEAYSDFARSARNAVLLSSPLVVPPGEYEIAKDIVVDFDPKKVLR